MYVCVCARVHKGWSWASCCVWRPYWNDSHFQWIFRRLQEYDINLWWRAFTPDIGHAIDKRSYAPASHYKDWVQFQNSSHEISTNLQTSWKISTFNCGFFMKNMGLYKLYCTSNLHFRVLIQTAEITMSSWLYLPVS